MWENVSQRGPFDNTALHLCFLRLWAYCGQEASERSRGLFVYVLRRRQRNRSVSILLGLYTMSAQSVSMSHPCTDSLFQSDKHAHTLLSLHTHHGLSLNRSTTMHKHHQVRKPSKSEIRAGGNPGLLLLHHSARHGADAEGTCAGKAVTGNRYKPTDPWLMLPYPTISSKDNILYLFSI